MSRAPGDRELECKSGAICDFCWNLRFFLIVGREQSGDSAQCRLAQPSPGRWDTPLRCLQSHETLDLEAGLCDEDQGPGHWLQLLGLDVNTD